MSTKRLLAGRSGCAGSRAMADGAMDCGDTTTLAREADPTGLASYFYIGIGTIIEIEVRIVGLITEATKVRARGAASLLGALARAIDRQRERLGKNYAHSLERALAVKSSAK